jgi:hypothetical protein
MALKRWRWAWGPGLAAVMVALLMLPPQAPTDHGVLAALGLTSSWGWVGARDFHRESVQSAVATQRRRLRDRRLADSILGATRGPRALRSMDGTVTVVYEAPLDRDSALVWLEAATNELNLYPKVSRPGLPVVVALFSNPVRGKGKREYEDYSLLSQQLISAAESRGACVVTLDLRVRTNDELAQFVGHGASGEPLGRFLDVCALYARFGSPAAAARGFVPVPTWSWFNRSPLTIRVQEAGRYVRRESIAHEQQSGSQPWSGAVAWVELGCLRGTPALCARWVGLGGPSETRWFYPYSRYASRTRVLAYLLARGTPVQFAAFWHSSLPVEAALASAYGQPAGQVVMSAYSHWYNTPEAGGPQAGSGAVLGGLLWTGLALTLALVAGRRGIIER